MDPRIKAFFQPKSVAVIGASRNPRKIGHIIVSQMLRAGFEGKLFPINPKASEILGLRAYSSVLEVEDDIDLAIISVPAQHTIEVLRECGKKGIMAAVVIAGGFSEVGNRELEKKLVDEARKWEIRVMGPNCMGVYSPPSKVDMLFTPDEVLPRARRGNVAVLSQSGSLAAGLMTMLAKHEVGVSRFVSYGNAADVDEADLLEYLSQDEETKVIALYVEGLKDGRRFFEVAREVSPKKPVVVMKGGRSGAGTRAVMSHTGSLAGKEEIYEAALKQCGSIAVRTLEEFVDVCLCLATQPPAMGRSVGIITNGGGYGVVAVDSLEEQGLKILEIPDNVKEELEKKLPPFYSISNPLDLTGSCTSEQYRAAIKAMLSSKEFDCLMIIALMSPPLLDRKKLIDYIIELSSSKEKPIVVVSLEATEEITEQLRRLKKAGIPYYTDPFRAAKALTALVRFGEVRKRLLNGCGGEPNLPNGH